MSVRAFASASLMAVLVAVAATTVGAQLSQTLPERQLPVFRTDSHFVRVDVYPTAKDGSTIQGLTDQDFEIFEDGKPQAVDSSEYIEYERWSPGVDPPEVETQRESFRLAADPRYRVAVVYVNRLNWENANWVREPLLDLLTREIGPRDLYGLLLPHHEASDLVLGKFTPAERARLVRFLSIKDHDSPFEADPLEQQLMACFGQNSAVVRRWRDDNLYRDLEGIITILGTIRDERKSLILVTESMPGAGFRRRGGGGGGGGSSTPQGRPPQPSRLMPGSTGLSSGTFNPNEGANICDMLARDAPYMAPDRFENLLKLAQRQNVAIYPVNPAGIPSRSTGDVSGYLRMMASETNGIAVVNMNDIKAGLQKVVHDVPAYYLLGYYTTNTKWDGKRREIKVKLKSTGKTIRARREYLSPSAADVAAMRAAADAPPRPAGPTPIESALSDLARLRNSVDLHVQGAVSEGTLTIAVEVPLNAAGPGGWYEGAEVEVASLSDAGHTARSTVRMVVGARGAEVSLPIEPGDPGPWQLRATVTRGQKTLEDSARIAIDPESIFSQPLLYRAASPPVAPFVPAADQQFFRSERLRAEWTVTSPTPVRLSARLRTTGGTALSYAPPVVTDEREGHTRARIDLQLSSLATGDYLVELVAESNGPDQSTLLAIRVVR